MVRFLVVLTILAAIVIGAMAALIAFVHVTPRPMEQTIPPARLK